MLKVIIHLKTRNNLNQPSRLILLLKVWTRPEAGMYAILSVCLFVRMSICVCLSVCLSMHVSVCVSIFTPTIDDY